MRPIGDWSIEITLSSLPTPSIPACRPGRASVPYSSRATALWRISLTSVDLPDPDTPVTLISRPRGKATSMALRLCSAAPRTVIAPLPPPLLRSGTGIELRPER